MQNFRSLLKQPVIHFSLALLVSLAFIFHQIEGRWQSAPYADEVTYMSIGLSLFDTGIYKDGTFEGTNQKKGPNSEGMFFAPLYPAFLASLMNLSPDFTNTVRCVVKHIRPVVIEKECAPLDLRIMITTQSLLMSLGALFAFIAAWALTKHMGIAWITLFIFLTGRGLAKLPTVSMSENVLIPLFCLTMLVTLLAWQKRTWRWAIASGLSFGFLCLVKPTFSYLLLLAVPLLIALACLEIYKHKKRKPLALMLVFCIGCSSVCAPWIFRNGTKIGVWDISYGLAPFTFVQRVSYNDMTWPEWGALFLISIPGFGDDLAEKLLPESTYSRLSFDNPDGYYKIGNHKLRPEIAEKAGSYDKQFPYLIENYLMETPVKHAMVTLPLAWRGMWVSGKKTGLIAIPAFFIFFIIAAVKKRWDFVIYAAPPIFLLGLHAFTSVNIPRYNLIMLPAIGIAFGWVLWLIWERLIKKTKAQIPGLENSSMDKIS